MGSELKRRSFRCTDAEWEAAAVAAKRVELTRSEWLRRLIRVGAKGVVVTGEASDELD